MSDLRAPVLPCWYCEGHDGEGDPYRPEVHLRWDCEACEERARHQAALRTARREMATEAAQEAEHLLPSCIAAHRRGRHIDRVGFDLRDALLALADADQEEGR